jgi:hypothetical protein
MAGLVPAIHVLSCPKNVDARHKAGYDAESHGESGYFHSTFFTS